jgi:hypothetical protein
VTKLARAEKWNNTGCGPSCIRASMLSGGEPARLRRSGSMTAIRSSCMVSWRVHGFAGRK